MKIVRVKNVTKSNIKVEYFVNDTTVTLCPDEVLDVGVFDVTKERIYRSMIKRGLQVKFVKVPDNYVFTLKDDSVEIVDTVDTVCLSIPAIDTDICDTITVTDSIDVVYNNVDIVCGEDVVITEDNLTVEDDAVVDTVVEDVNEIEQVVVSNEQEITETVQMTDESQEQIDVQIEEKPKRGRKKKVEVDTEVEADN